MQAALGLQLAGYVLEAIEQLVTARRDVLHAGHGMGRHAAVLAHVLDKAANGFCLLVKLGLGQVLVQGNKAIDDHRGGMTAGNKALELVHGLGDGAAKAHKGAGERCVGCLHVLHS